MVVILGLVILVAAVVVGVAGVLANGGHAHAVSHFAVFGYHVTGSTGTLFLAGIVVGALALAGLSLLLAGARRTSRRGRDARRGLAQSQRETAAVSADRDDLRGQRDTARAYTASTLGDDGTTPNGTTRAHTADAPAYSADAPAAQPEPPADQAGADQAVAVPAGAVPAGADQAVAVPAGSVPAGASAPAE
jgi:hypothetical protein